MKITYLAHSAFLITAEDGTRIMTDPYTAGGDIHYGPIDEPADVVTVSHDHFDHNNTRAVPGASDVLTAPGKAGGISFRCVATHHDESGGSQRGDNNMFCFTVDGVNVCHAGDLGHTLSPEQIDDTGRVDVLFIPVGGYYTIDATAASRVCEQLRPGIAIPMHYKTDRIDFPIAGVDGFLKGKGNVTRLDASEVEITADRPGAATRIIVLQPAK